MTTNELYAENISISHVSPYIYYSVLLLSFISSQGQHKALKT